MSLQMFLSSLTGVLIHLVVNSSNSSAFANLHTLESALAVLSHWFCRNWLALNPDKSDAILLGTRQCHSTLSNISHINVAGSTVPLSDTVKLLGITLDKSVTFHHMRALRHIRHCLNNHAASRIAHQLPS